MTRKISIIVVFAIVLITSCKKYPDGPWFNLESKYTRIAGSWEAYYFLENGTDSTTHLQNQPYYGIFTFSDKSFQGGNLFYFMTVNPTNIPEWYDTEGYWKFSDFKKNLVIHMGAINPSSCGPYRAEEVTWRIMRLMDNDLWLQTTYNNNEYFMKLKKH